MPASYVINSEAAAKLYATMKNRPGSANEPRDLGREWHSDSLSLFPNHHQHPLPPLLISLTT